MDVQCGPRGLKGAGDSLFYNNSDGTFTDVSKAAEVWDPNGYYGMQAIWADLNNVGRLDIYVANDSTPKYLYKNEGNGKFTEMGLEGQGIVPAEKIRPPISGAKQYIRSHHLRSIGGSAFTQNRYCTNVSL
jgi:enediyne biosynthesis protein E4